SFTATTSTRPLAPPAVKQHLAAIRMLLDWLVVGQVMPFNPASSVRGPKHVVKRGKTPVLSTEDARRLLDSIPLTRKGLHPEEKDEVADLVGLRDRAFIGVMVYSFARVSAVCAMKVEDYYQNGKRCWFRLHEKGGKFHEVPAHHNAQAYLDEYLSASRIAAEKKTPLFRAAAGRTNTFSESGVSRTDVFRMIKRRAVAAGLPARISCHTFRATGITAYLEAGGTIEKAQAIAAHESPRTTKLYDRTNSELTLDEIERIAI
ncbi:MAG TPA: tyrosine-type recombinase/integrase, partial [Verrucomicrobiota bacterium]|nr:tyrosine-type recombinase/integrase [Verrucomicrobiota bacterium]